MLKLNFNQEPHETRVCKNDFQNRTPARERKPFNCRIYQRFMIVSANNN